MAAFVHFHDFFRDVGLGVHNFSTHSFKYVLTNTAPVASTGSVLADIVEIAGGNGYTAGGHTLDSEAWAETSAGSGIWQLTVADEVLTASGGSIGPFRYVVFFNDTPAGDPLVGYLDFGASITVTAGATFTIDVQALGVFRLGAGTLS